MRVKILLTPILQMRAVCDLIHKGSSASQKEIATHNQNVSHIQFYIQIDYASQVVFDKHSGYASRFIINKQAEYASHWVF